MTGRQLRVLTLIPACIAINVIMGQVVAISRLPLYLDSIGTILVAALAGPAAGALAGLVGTAFWALTDPGILPFALPAAAVGGVAGVVARLGGFRHPLAAVAGGLATGCLSAAFSAPLQAGVFKGVTGGGTDLIVALFRAHGASVIQASFMQSLTTDPVDKALSFILVWTVLQALPRRYRQRFA